MAKAKQAAVDTTLYSSGFFAPIAEKCDGCERIVEVDNNKYCQSYALPEAKWRLGICNFATHVKPEIAVSTVKVNPLKAAKRASAK
ncbi:MAG: PxxKW family cysteine-rich protein [Thermodesulfobacteriota bacterium]